MKIDVRQLPKARLDFIPPMLARPVNELPSVAGWTYELKLDGYRALVLKTRGVTTLFSRCGNNLSNNYPTITRALSFLPDDTMVDGELVVLDEQGRPTFSALQKSRFFDLLAYQGRDLRKLPLLQRRELLEGYVLRGMRDPIRLSDVLSFKMQSQLLFSFVIRYNFRECLVVVQVEIRRRW
jgi:bifunctional non-homologous end joining protein LigD